MKIQDRVMELENEILRLQIEVNDLHFMDEKGEYPNRQRLDRQIVLDGLRIASEYIQKRI